MHYYYLYLMVEKENKIRASSWKFDESILYLLSEIAKHEKESQATILRQLIKKEAKRLKIEPKS